MARHPKLADGAVRGQGKANFPSPALYRALMLSSIEIRYAEARRHDVWLATDRGWMRAATHGLDNVVDELTKFGFVRIHRSYVVNIARICEVQHHGKGVLTLSTTRGNKRQSRCRGVTRSS